MTAGRPPRFPLGLQRLNAIGRGVAAATTGRGEGDRELLRPQQHLRLARQSSTDATRQGAPGGVGLDTAAVRQRMVQRLRAGGVADERVLAAFAQVERHRFVDTALVGQAYEDTSLPIGLQQTISKPSVVAHMLALLHDGAWAREHGDLGHALEIGTGSGYQAALLAVLARRVVSLERLLPLHRRAAQVLAQARVGGSLELIHADGCDGHAAGAPFHSIIAAAGGTALPAAWLAQLARGGRLVAPAAQGGDARQRLCIVDRLPGGELRYQHHETVRFVPLKSGTA